MLWDLVKADAALMASETKRGIVRKSLRHNEGRNLNGRAMESLQRKVNDKIRFACTKGR